MKKTYVLDTNVLLSDPNSLFSFEEHNVIIPLIVLEELDRQKNRSDDVGRNARQVNRKLDDMRGQGKSLLSGVILPNGGKLTVQMLSKEHATDMPTEFDSEKVDNLIIVFMMWLKKQSSKSNQILVSKDINVRIKCDSVGVKCEDYRKMRVAQSEQKFYRGVKVVEVEGTLIDSLYNDRLLKKDNLPNEKIYSNQIVIVKEHINNTDQSTRKSAITRFNEKDEALIPIDQIDDVFGLKPRNKEQSFSFDLLLDPDVKLLTLTGPSGTGKTILALAAGLEQLKSIGKYPEYERIIVTRPVQPVGKDIGFLPGTLEEKMEPWLAPVKDNLNFLMGSFGGDKRLKKRRNDKNNGSSMFAEPYLSLMQEKGLIEIEAITYIRGRSIPKSFIVIDEAQNLSMHELKTIITRVGDGTKIVLTGDIEQIDNAHLDAFTNGLSYAVERFKECDLAGHVTLLKGERSPLATIASKIL